MGLRAPQSRATTQGPIETYVESASILNVCSRLTLVNAPIQYFPLNEHSCHAVMQDFQKPGDFSKERTVCKQDLLVRTFPHKCRILFATPVKLQMTPSMKFSKLFMSTLSVQKMKQMMNASSARQMIALFKRLASTAIRAWTFCGRERSTTAMKSPRGLRFHIQQKICLPKLFVPLPELDSA